MVVPSAMLASLLGVPAIGDSCPAPMIVPCYGVGTSGKTETVTCKTRSVPNRAKFFWHYVAEISRQATSGFKSPGSDALITSS